MMEHFAFYIGICFILAHEMDAIRCKEWRIFPGLSMLKDETGYIVFVVAHVPLYFWLIKSLQTQTTNLIWALDVFFLVHTGLHMLFLRHPNNQFKSIFSWVLIAGAGLFGLIDLLIFFLTDRIKPSNQPLI